MNWLANAKSKIELSILSSVLIMVANDFCIFPSKQMFALPLFYAVNKIRAKLNG